MSIATELQRILATKKDLRNALNIDDSVPFSQYAAHIPWHGEKPPANAKYFDLIKNRYSANGLPAKLVDLGGRFTRLSTATEWENGFLVDVAPNTMRLDKNKGLLIEPQRTCLTSWSTLPASATYLKADVEFSEGSWKSPNGDGYLYPTPRNTAYTGVMTASITLVDPTKKLYRSATASGYILLSGLSGFIQFGTLTGSPGLLTGVNWPYGDPGARVLSYQLENGENFTSLIKTTTTPVTRAKETFIVTLEPGQTIISDKDSGIIMTMLGNDAVFEGHGHLRYIWVD